MWPNDKEEKIHLLMDFSERPRAVADPWYTGDFDITYSDIKEGLDGFLRFLGKQI